jgi:hypothetical protein
LILKPVDGAVQRHHCHQGQNGRGHDGGFCDGLVSWC